MYSLRWCSTRRGLSVSSVVLYARCSLCSGTMSNLPAQFILTQHFGIQEAVITKTLLSTANQLLSTPVSLFCIKHLFLINAVQRQPTHSTESFALSITFKGIGIFLKNDMLDAGWLDRIPSRSAGLAISEWRVHTSRLSGFYF